MLTVEATRFRLQRVTYDLTVYYPLLHRQLNTYAIAVLVSKPIRCVFTSWFFLQLELSELFFAACYSPWLKIRATLS